LSRRLVPRPRLRVVAGRALGLRCPRCGQSPLFTGWFTMRDGCAACGFRYEREPGYFIGAIYLNYAAAVVAGGGTVLLLDWAVGLSLGRQLALAVTLVTLLPLVCFRHARSIWLAIDFLVSRLDAAHAPRRR
jgi:uncharacterized protein (DUF983 family)